MLRRCFVGMIIIGWVLALLSMHVPVGAERGKVHEVTADQDVVPDELLVAIQPGYMPYLRLSALSATATGISELDLINRRLRVRSIQPLLGPEFGYMTARRGSSGLERVFVVKLPPGSDLEAALQLFRQQNFIEYAEPNHVYRALDFIPNDPFWRDQWALPKIQLPQAWEISQGQSDRVIAVLDTGVDYRHPDLKDKVLHGGRNFVNNNDDSDAMDDQGHGTHVAGIAAAATNNEVGVAGVCPQCQILPIKVLDSQGTGNATTVAQGIEYAVEQGARIVNLSLGGPNCSETLAQAINGAFNRGVLIIAASGNNGSKISMSYPARSPRVVSVGAVDQYDVEAQFSQRDETLDLLAPGVDIYSTVINSGYMLSSGTSMAAPHVAGVAGLLWSQNPGWRNTEVWWALRYTYSAGSLAIGESPWRLYLPLVANSQVARLNAYRALQVTSPGQVEAPEDTCAN
ncbi:peptidase S8 [uncultured Thermanaerothrix sp.]|uniref:peptidase S8 n=1 Tax=uncultured Thermanaerothrix sp. TaxID=1195149 RepID=UPI002622D77C|nr:peptidase S8 [uncultured Thermanaerothrix sp.]